MGPLGRNLLAALVLGLLATAGQAALTIPPAPFGPPHYYVLDPSDSIPKNLAATLRRMLTEHDRVNDEQVVLAVLDSAEGEDPTALTHRIFDEWKVGNRGKDNGALLVLFMKERASALMAGAGLDDALGENERKRIASEIVSKELRAGSKEGAARATQRAASLGVLEILKNLHSPLVSDGRAEDELRAAGFAGEFVPQEWEGEPAIRTGGAWWLWLLVALAACSLAFFALVAAEAHFTSSGWFRPSPWRWKRWQHEWLGSGSKEKLGGAHGSW